MTDEEVKRILDSVNCPECGQRRPQTTSKYRQRRLEIGLSLNQLASAATSTSMQVSDLEHGRPVASDAVARIALALGMTLEDVADAGAGTGGET